MDSQLLMSELLVDWYPFNIALKTCLLKWLCFWTQDSSVAFCSSDPSILKRPIDKESNGVYVIEEHFHVPDAISSGLFATEV